MSSRVLLKLSGEQLGGTLGKGFDIDTANWIAGEIKRLMDNGLGVAIMIGGGNFVRGVMFESKEINNVTADNAGMLATLINATLLGDVFKYNGLDAKVLTNILCGQAADDFTNRRALHNLAKNRVLILGGGTGRPYVTTDTAAVLLALELKCDLVVKATKVDGVFDRDPQKFPDAERLASVTYARAVEDENIRVMDKTALATAENYNIPIVVCELSENKPGNILKAIQGQAGTRIG
ncbi:uridine monophosphate kinase [Candidatus Saccharibacteria bacterium]|nr:uridine monophosphate kinase [Candidatus Saccharibacteria bacterium]